jgi:hypothetical protein
MSAMITMQQLDNICFNTYGLHVDNRYVDQVGYNMGSFSVQIPARSSVRDIASKFNETIGRNKVKNDPQQPGYSFVATAIHVDKDVVLDDSEARVYSIALTGTKFFYGNTQSICGVCIVS